MKKLPFTNKNACLITDELTGKYLTGLSLDEGYLILADEMTLLVDARYYSATKTAYQNTGVNVKLFTCFKDLKEFLQSLNVQTLYLDFSKITVKQFNEYKAFGFEIQDAEKYIIDARAVKSQTEIDNIVKACEIAEKAYHKAMKQVRLGMTEIELKQIIEQNIVNLGGQGASFETIVAFGKNGAVPHHKTCNDRLSENMPILVDMGAIFNGYMSDITRMAYFGTPTKKFLDCYSQVLLANQLAIEKIKLGTKTNQADAFARESLQKANLDKYFTHSLGHGIGIEVHEFPALSFRKEDELKENMVFTIEPGVYIDGEFGIRIEDTVLLTKSGVKRLFTDSKELLILPIK